MSNPDHQELLLAALHEAPRRHRLPALPADVDAAREQGPRTALAFAIDAARMGHDGAAAPGREVEALFTWALAQLLVEALAPEGGDPEFQAVALRARDAEVAEHVALTARVVADRREVQSAIDAVAHPGKLRALPGGPLRNALGHLHELALDRAWTELARAIREVLARDEHGHDIVFASLRHVLASAALDRLQRGTALLASAAVQQYLTLCGQNGLLAGTEAAQARGRASGRLGDAAEQSTLQAFRAIAALLDRAGGHHRAVHGLHTPRGFPGVAGRAKNEWDVAIVRSDGMQDAADILLLAEVKATPGAAAADLPRLLRGLHRLAQTKADEELFPSADGEVRLRGESLRMLQPHDDALPASVVYCCPAPPEPAPVLLTPASRAILMAEPASLAFAQRWVAGASPEPAMLRPVWEALAEPRLRGVLRQDVTARLAREALVDPADLLSAAESLLQSGSRT